MRVEDLAEKVVAGSLAFFEERVKVRLSSEHKRVIVSTMRQRVPGIVEEMMDECPHSAVDPGWEEPPKSTW